MPEKELEPPNEITINGEVYVRKDSLTPKPKYVPQGFYPVKMRGSDKKLVVRCFDPVHARFVIDGEYTESSVLYEHNFTWIGECCNKLWAELDKAKAVLGTGDITWRPAKEGDTARNLDTGELDVFQNGEWQRTGIKK